MEKNIAVIWGDCSSPEIVKQTLRVLDKVAEKYGHTFHYIAAAMGGEAIDKYGDPLPQHELDKCLAADSVGHLVILLIDQPYHLQRGHAVDIGRSFVALLGRDSFEFNHNGPP